MSSYEYFCEFSMLQSLRMICCIFHKSIDSNNLNTERTFYVNVRKMPKYSHFYTTFQMIVVKYQQ